MQHLVSEYRGEDVADEIPEADLLQRSTEGVDVGSMAEGGLAARYCEFI